MSQRWPAAPLRPGTYNDHPLALHHLGLFQGEAWCDHQAMTHRLCEMDLTYLLNVLDYLDVRAPWMHHCEVTTQAEEREVGRSRGMSRGADLESAPLTWPGDSPERWLAATPLRVALLDRTAARRFMLTWRPSEQVR